MSANTIVAACQLPEVRENVNEAISWMVKYAGLAESQGASLVCFPECFLQGYLVEGELARRNALDLMSAGFQSLLRRLTSVKPTIVFGMIEACAGELFNTAVVVEGGRLIGSYRKTHLLPGESIFSPGTSYPLFDAGGLKFGINICWDTNFPESSAAVATQGARLIVRPSNNMMRRQNAEKWKHLHNEIRASRIKETGLWLISSDVTGAHGDSIAYGPTSVIGPRGSVVAQVPLMEIGMVTAAIPN